MLQVLREASAVVPCWHHSLLYFWVFLAVLIVIGLYSSTVPLLISSWQYLDITLPFPRLLASSGHLLKSQVKILQ